MVTKENYIEWLTKSYMKNLDDISNQDIKNLIKQAFKLGALNVNLDNVNLGNLQKDYVELFEAIARGFISGLKLGTSFDHSNTDDLENIMKKNPDGLNMK